MKIATIRGRLFAAAALILSASPGFAQNRPITVGVALQSLGVPYAVAMNDGVKQAAKELGVKLVEVDANHDLLKQANDVDRFIAQGVNGILVDPADSQSAMDWADKAQAAKIPMVSMGVWVGNPAQHEPPYVYPSLLALADHNDMEQAYALGQLAVKENPGGGKIAILEGLPGFATVEFRNRGFTKALKQAKTPYNIVLQKPGNWDPAQGFSLCQNAVHSNPDLRFIFSQDQGMAQGCYKALQAAGSHAAIYTIDFSRQLQGLIKDGAPITTACSQPRKSGYDAMTTLVTYIRTGKKPQNPYLTYHSDIIRAGNINQCPVQF